MNFNFHRSTIDFDLYVSMNIHTYKQIDNSSGNLSIILAEWHDELIAKFFYY